nr:hypothetical protein [uncultured Amphritea sp.]
MKKNGQRLLLAGCLLLGSLGQQSKADLSLEAFERQLDVTIRSACHGYMVDALPELLSSAKYWLKESSPFCQTILTLPQDQSAYHVLKRQNPDVDIRKDPDYKIKYLTGYNEDLHRHNDCHDWMCEHIRDNAYRAGNPVSLLDYKKVAAFCDEGYGCIENWFKAWPRPLPTSPSSGRSLDELMASTEDTLSTDTWAKPADTDLSLDTMLTSSATPDSFNEFDSSVATPSVDLSTVMEGREQLKIRQKQADLAAISARIKNICSCQDNRSGCFKLSPRQLNLTQPSTIQKAAEINEARTYGLESSCIVWQKQTRQTPSSLPLLDKQIALITNIESDLLAGIKAAKQKGAQLSREDRAIQTEIAARKESSGFSLGKALALGTGALAGGLAKLDTESQAKIITAIVQDSMTDDANISSLQSTTRNIRNDTTRASISAAPTTPHQPTQAASASPLSETFAICKTYPKGTSTTAGCINIRQMSEHELCSGPNDINCSSTHTQDLCLKVGQRIGVPFEEFSSGLGTFSNAQACIAKCEQNYGNAWDPKFGRKCLGLVSSY